LLLQGFVLFNLSRFFISLDKTGQGRLYWVSLLQGGLFSFTNFIFSLFLVLF
jgi:hypothetical protein